jgi:tetratricopeptide (TPR) repeat protein
MGNDRGFLHLRKVKGSAMKKLSFIVIVVLAALLYVNSGYGKGVPERDYRIAVVLFNEAEYENAEIKFSTVIEEGDMSNPKAAAYVVNSYYGRASCRIEQGRRLKEDKKLDESLEKYTKAYEDLSIFKSKFEELQDTLSSDVLYDEMEKHFVTVSDQMVQLAGEAGDICSEQGKYDTAIDWYDRGLLYITPRNPTYGDILYAKADSYYRLDDYNETLRLLSRFEEELSSHDKADEAMLFAGDIHRMMAEASTDPANSERHLEKALDAYRQVINTHLEGEEVELLKIALLEKARVEKKLGRMEEAIEDFKTIQTYYPDTRYDVEAAMEIGDYSFLAKQYQDSLESFDRSMRAAKSLGLQDLVAISYYWIGWSYFKEASRFDLESTPEMKRTARNLYEKAMDAFQDSIKNTDRFWKKEGRDIKRSNELEGYHGESLFMIGRCYQNLEQWDKAIETFEQIPNTYKEWWLKGLAEIAVSKEGKGDIDGALDQWDELKRGISIARMPNIELELLMRRAESIFDLQRYTDAEKAYTEIIVKYPNSVAEPRARINLGLSLFKQDRNIEAIQEFSTMLSKYGRDDSIGTMVGEALFWKGYLTARAESGSDSSSNLRQAIRDYKELVGRFPRHIRADDAQFEIAFCTYSMGISDQSKYSEAISEYSKVLQNYPESEYSDDALFEIARCYQLLENETKREESLRQLVLDYPTSELADDSLLRIAEIHYERLNRNGSIQEREAAENAYGEIISKYPGTESEAISHFQIGSITYKYDGNFFTAAMEFEKCASVVEGLLDKVETGQYISLDLDITTIANLLLRSTFWSAESLFKLARENELQASPTEEVRQAYARSRSAYQKLLDRGTRLRSNFPDATQNIYSIMGGEKLDIPIVSEAQFMISRCFYKEGDFQSARNAVDLVKGPERLQMKAKYLLASIDYKQGNLSSARTKAESWLNDDLAEDMADEYKVGMQNLLSNIEMESGNIDEAKAQALDTWAIFQSTDGLWEEAAYIVANCYQKQNNAEKAASWFGRLRSSSYELWRSKALDFTSQ